MKVTLIVDSLSRELSGIGRYTWALCRGLGEEPGIESISYFAGGRFIDDPAALLRGGLLRRKRWLPRPVRDRLTARRLRGGLVHGPNYFLPPQVESGIVTIHDLSVLRYPEMHPVDRVLQFERQFHSSLARAVHVITDSETVRGELLEHFSLAPESVSAIALGVDPRFVPLDEGKLAPALNQWGLTPGSYGLSVATFEPRKKIAELIAAWKCLPKALREHYPLVLGGPAGWRNEELRRAALQAQSEGWVKNLGFVDDALLPSLYAGARLFVYPSIYEGFGLPAVEGMASGIPVIVSNRSCLPEVCGDGAIYADPDDPEAFTATIGQALCDERLRSDTIACGIARASEYSWERCVAETAALYVAQGS